MSYICFTKIWVTIPMTWSHTPFYMRTNTLSLRDNFGNNTLASSTWHSCLNDGKIKKKIMRAFSRKLRVKFLWRVFPDKIKINYPLFETSFFVQCIMKINTRHSYSNGQHSKQNSTFKHPSRFKTIRHSSRHRTFKTVFNI